MKVIFLDIDGVLNNTSSMHEGVHLLPEKCLLIDSLCNDTGAVIVVSSTWRLCYDIKILETLLWRSGISSTNIIDVTPDIPNKGSIRGMEIEKWLSETKENIESFVILDDDSDFFHHQTSFFVKIDRDAGITRRNCEQAKKILNVDC